MMREIDKYADNEEILQQVLDFTRSITRKKTDPTEMTKDDFFKKLEESRQQAREGKVQSFSNLDEMHQWLKTL
ncbi:MAG: hypothetical protein IKQ30_08860 [Bacteroidales bacterium]|nr:hypothetical protein [Bacteroidales bacterium]